MGNCMKPGKNDDKSCNFQEPSAVPVENDLRAFTYTQLVRATKNFLPENVIGEGGFGYVYKGWINEQPSNSTSTEEARMVAVKKLKLEGNQGHKEWLTEVDILGRLRHENLVTLIGYCIHGRNRLLVYEYMEGGNLESHLFRRHTDTLSWDRRIRIAMDIARGLQFLHENEKPVIYRDLKSSNILLDSEFHAKLSDFGLAREGPIGESSHVSSQVVGTQGYAAPEYVATGKLTTKCDVYSFGIVLLELLTGRRVIERRRQPSEQNLVVWARPYLGDKNRFFRIMDIKLRGQFLGLAGRRACVLALDCTSPANHRPTMAEVFDELQSISEMRSQLGDIGASSSSANAGASPRTPSDMPTSPAAVEQGSPLQEFLQHPL